MRRQAGMVAKEAKMWLRKDGIQQAGKDEAGTKEGKR